ncbi:uncharacterized protein METZ01_LOCUS351858 [marine metagenome]|uniref:Uncharacterized protein n=1 Tax=marine metagenome TaxID=408172 RepID=A0A382RMS2_9ZZZZ
MAPSLDLQLTQLRRLIEKPDYDHMSVRSHIEEDPAALARALFVEVVASDDVISEENARSYLDLRINFFDDFLSKPTKTAVKTAFEGMLEEWNIH